VHVADIVPGVGGETIAAGTNPQVSEANAKEAHKQINSLAGETHGVSRELLTIGTVALIVWLVSKYL
jgi:hypothetical protein